MRTTSFFVLGGIWVSMAGLGCGSTDVTCEDKGTCGGEGGTDGGKGGTGGTAGKGGTGGTGATGGAGGDGGGCDTSKSPSEEACLVSEEHAVFVNGTATTSGSGTKSSPFKTIGEGIAAAAGKIVIVCDTTYDEQVKITAGVKIFGGFKCADWSVDTGQRAIVKPAARGFALEISDATDAVVIEDFEFGAQDGVDPGEHSIAAFVHGSPQVALARSKFVAGKGVTGAKGTLTTFTFPTAGDQVGNNGSGDTGGATKPCACPDGSSAVGGKGGDGAAGVTGGGPGLPNLGGGLGGQAGASCSGNGTGGDGAPNSTIGDKPGASTSGAVSASGWTGSAGTDGANGPPGQGGGGGAGSASGGGGGAGGCGGCGGSGGGAGKAGGSSIALLVLDSSIVVTKGEFSSGAAGDGGAGVNGQPGQTIGGAGGTKSGFACNGGNGGKGADGGAGGGGAGGVSVGIAWMGTSAPDVDGDSTYALGAKGNKGVGGKAGSNDGIDGVSQKTIEIQ